MRYLGGKARVAKQLCAYLEQRREGRYFVEPFMGGLNVTERMSGPRLAADVNPFLFTLYSAVRDGWDPPETVSEETYKRLKEEQNPTDPLTAFAGFGCSFGGKWFGGYARGGEGRNYAANARSVLKRQLSRCSEVTFAHCSYERLSPGSALVYCDPPYAGTTGYAATEGFDHGAFWRRCREWAADGAIVLVSEYSAPPDTSVVLEIQTRTDLHGAGRAGRVERLFEVHG